MRFRSAITGRWVTRFFARTNPNTTVGESITPSIVLDNEGGLDERPGTMQCQYCGKWTRSFDVCEWCGSDLRED